MSDVRPSLWPRRSTSEALAQLASVQLACGVVDCAEAPVMTIRSIRRNLGHYDTAYCRKHGEIMAVGAGDNDKRRRDYFEAIWWDK